MKGYSNFFDISISSTTIIEKGEVTLSKNEGEVTPNIFQISISTTAIIGKEEVTLTKMKLR